LNRLRVKRTAGELSFSERGGTPFRHWPPQCRGKHHAKRKKFAEISFDGLCCENATARHNLYVVQEKISEAYFLVLRAIFT
jgi:hypothetical protein